jgi:hypothetical protein
MRSAASSAITPEIDGIIGVAGGIIAARGVSLLAATTATVFSSPQIRAILCHDQLG